jgi:hypothetical protein
MSTQQIVTLISEDECIGDSLDTINNNFALLGTLLASISAILVTDVESTKTTFIGNGITTIWAIANGVSLNPNNYRVDINGVLQEPETDYTVSLNQINFTQAPPNGSKVVVITNA